MHVVVVGGGVSGIATAWNIHEAATGEGLKPPQVTVLEARSRPGGNAVTHCWGGAGGATGEGRWVDLGVNDFNAATYTRILKAMDRIGFVKGVDYRPLGDSTTYATRDGRVLLRDAGAGRDALAAPLARSLDDFMACASADAMRAEFSGYTIEDYIDAMTPERGWDERLGPLLVYPRVNAMYFTSAETGPRAMPLRAVMQYYSVQEGAGAGVADRCYFVKGAASWIERLAGYVERQMDVRFAYDYPAKIVRALGGGFHVINSHDAAQRLRADVVVFACHADQIADAAAGALPPPVLHLVKGVRHERARVMAHRRSEVLPYSCRDWASYNVRIDPWPVGKPSPYTIDYVLSLHQNQPRSARASQQPDGADLIVSVNPAATIPADDVCLDTDGRRMWREFEHNVLDFAGLRLQRDIADWQGVGDLYYAGAWTAGSGLHEECWARAEHVGTRVARAILSCGQLTLAATTRPASVDAIVSERTRPASVA